MHRTENLFNNAGMNAYASNLLSFGMIGITALLCCVLGSCLASLMVLGLEKNGSSRCYVWRIDMLTRKTLTRKLLFSEMTALDQDCFMGTDQMFVMQQTFLIKVTTEREQNRSLHGH